jgi:hypothetical protein
MAAMRPRGSGSSRRPEGAADSRDPAYWKGVKSGDFVGLRDAEAFDERLAEGASESEDYAVGDIRTFAVLGRDKSPQGEYRFIELRGAKGGSLYLTLVETGPGASAGSSGAELRLYFIPEGLACGTRDELIDAGQTWLFLPPEYHEDFKSSELEYAPYPDVPEIRDGGKSRKLAFSRSGSGASLYGEAADTGAAVIISEYEAESPPGEDPPANPLLIVLEEGWMRPDGSQPEEGGYLTVMLGKVARPGDIEHFPT